MGKRSGRWTLALVLALACVFSLTSVSVMALQSGDGSGDSATAESSASADGVGSLASAAAAAISDDADAAGDGTASAEAVADGASSLTAAAEAYEAELETAAVSEDGADAEADGSELAAADATAASGSAVTAADDDATTVAGDDGSAELAAADDYDATLDAAADDEVTSITVECANDDLLMSSGYYAACEGDEFQFVAYDQDGNQLGDVTWSLGTNLTSVSLDSETGVLTITKAIYSGSTVTPQVVAAYTDESSGTTVSSDKTKFTMQGWKVKSSSTLEVTLAEDGQDEETISVGGGISGYSSWTYDEEAAEGIARLESDADTTGTSFKFTALRPGSFTVTVSIDCPAGLTETVTATIYGVAVEDEDGENAKTYIDVNETSTDLVEQLSAYCEDGATVTAWRSSDETVATVDENGLVTATGDVGTAIIYADASDDGTGGIKVYCYDSATPWMENIAFTSPSFSTWTNGETYKIDQYDYQLTTSTTSVGSITVGADTAYDEEKYTVTYSYIDADGEEQAGTINNGATTSLSNIGYGDTLITFTVTSIEDPSLQTEYVFTVTKNAPSGSSYSRIKGSTGLAINPGSRDLVESEYEGEEEGTFFQASSDGSLTGKTGVSNTTYYYWTYLQRYEDSFTLDVTTYNNYAYVRYSVDGGETWTELGQGGGTTDLIEFADDEDVVEVQVQVIAYYYYLQNLEDGLDGFGDGETGTSTYTVWVERVLTEYSGSASESASDAYMLSASSDVGDWYEEFDPETYTYYIIVPDGTTSATLTYTISDGATAKVGSTAQSAGSDGSYTLALSTTSKTVTVTSASEGYSSEYTFKLAQKYSDAVPDSVVDYLCMGSQYTNSATYGLYPELTLTGSLKSLGNFGGYITYYYEDPLVDDPNNEYGVDLYIYGNAYENNRESLAEPGQVYVSEDGETWYMLAGSEHYEDTTIWDYTITYTRTDEDGAWWTDNLGNAIDTSVNYYANTSYPTSWPEEDCYYLNNDVASQDTYTYTGLLMLSDEDDTVMGSGTTSSICRLVDWGYVDAYSVGTVGASTNPYTATESNNGFDLAWAVDDDGNPVDVSDMEFHYVKVATASNIWAGVFNEKSTEVQYIVRADSTGSAVGETDTPDSVTITCGDEVETVELEEGTSVYEVEVGATGEASVLVNGTSADDAIWVNNQNVDSGTAATGFEVTSDGEELVRVIVQNGEKEPSIVLLRISGSAE